MAYLRLTHPSSSSLDLSSHSQPVLELTPLFPRPSPAVSAPSTPPRSRESRFVEDEEATPVNSGGHGEEVVESGWAGVSALRRDVKCVPLSPSFTSSPCILTLTHPSSAYWGRKQRLLKISRLLLHPPRRNHPSDRLVLLNFAPRRVLLPFYPPFYLPLSLKTDPRSPFLLPLH